MTLRAGHPSEVRRNPVRGVPVEVVLRHVVPGGGARVGVPRYESTIGRNRTVSKADVTVGIAR